MERRLRPTVRPAHTVVRSGSSRIPATRSVVRSDATLGSRPSGRYFDVKPAVSPLGKTVVPSSESSPIAQTPSAAPVAKAIETTETVQSVVQPSEPQVQMGPVNAPQETVRGRRHRHRKQKFGASHVFQGMASLLFIIGTYVAIDGWLVNRAVSEQTQVLSSQASTSDSSGEEVSETKPDNPNSYKVAPDLPRILEIPSIGVSTRVLQLGVKEDNTLAAPINIHDAGWYTGSAKPNDAAGAMLMDGHVSGPTKNGVFYNLKKLKTGDEITVERGDGQKRIFGVTRVETVQVEFVDMDELMRSDDPAKLGLNIITCGGLFDARTNTFKSRVLVFAVEK